MEINGTGIKKATLDDYLEAETSVIRADGTFGDNFTIKKEGVVDSLLTTFSNAMLALEDKIMYLAKQLNPRTAEDKFQDDLYSYINLTRELGDYTVVTRTISGIANTFCEASSIVFKTSQGDEFYLNSDVTINENGTVVGSFTAYETGAIECNEKDILTIVTAPLDITSVYFADGNMTLVGDDYEDNTEFRERWTIERASITANTEDGIKVRLLPLVDNNPKNLSIRQNRNSYKYPTLPLHTMEIIINTPESDETIAKTIFNNLTDGVGLFGTTTFEIEDSEGTKEEIKFSRAIGVPIFFEIEAVLNKSYILAQVISQVKQAIVDNFNPDMGEKIVANDYFQYINEVEGIDYIKTLKIKVQGGTLSDVINIEYNQFGQTLENNITIKEVE